MKIIWTFTLMMIPGVVSSISVKGYSGGRVTIKCKYDEIYKTNGKYLCRNVPLIICSDIIKTDIKDKWAHSGRFSLYDDTSSAVLTVSIRDLRQEDSDTYYCGTDISIGLDLYTEVKLKVITDPELTSPSSPPPSSSSTETPLQRMCVVN
ncbi:CMRF35-like molecule 8 [Pseudorasbora parva]|uniref:CMRF35-like molecule 8 n=1 Tax=Pseudorasbora parva TaxID=51549 RepID=UPI00351F073E